jgi:MFS family permease
VSAAKAEKFYGSWIVTVTFVTLGLAVGIPYYNLPFFYDYFQKNFHWSLRQITLGFPLAAILTIWIAPLVLPRFSQRKLIVVGTGLTALSFFGFGHMTGRVSVYFALFVVYAAGYLLSGPIPHQILVTHWFRLKRGRAMGAMYVGVGLFGGLGSFLVRGLTNRFGFQAALVWIGVLILLVWPLAMWFLRDKPADLNQFPDGASEATAELSIDAFSYRYLLHNRAFWLLLVGSISSIAAIGSINQHMKFVFRDEGFRNQAALNSAWTSASVAILWSSIVGRISIGWLADLWSKKTVMAATYAIVAATTVLLLTVRPGHTASLYLFSIVFGFSLGADYMLIPLMAAEQFGVNTLSRAMAIILPANTLGQTWCPYLVASLREQTGNYNAPIAVVFGIAAVGAAAILLLPRANLVRLAE